VGWLRLRSALDTSGSRWTGNDDMKQAFADGEGPRTVHWRRSDGSFLRDHRTAATHPRAFVFVLIAT
jgi:hypothetical protein